ncbi:MAG: hypothetical protein WBN62_05190 [Thermoanaerobaculia bacterium]
MITGYNTDVPHSGVVFHVQTEDKGIASAFIESLVYVGGQILAKKRTSYKSALEAGDSKKQIVELMDRQHRLTIAEIQSGKYDKQVPGARSAQSSMNAEEFLEQPTAPEVEVEHLSPPEPSRRIDAPDGESPTLDQIIMDYLNSESEQEALILMMDAEHEFALGETVELHFRTKGSLSGQVVPGTRISVKMISTVVEPATLAQGETNAEGDLRLSVDIPALRRGSSALIVTASSAIGTAEIKQLL